MAKHGADLILWVCCLALILVIVLFIIRVYLLSTLSEFEHDSRNPLDCCHDLNAVLPNESAMEYTVLVLSIVKWSRSKIAFLVYAAVVCHSLYLRRSGKYRYEPMNFVRDLTRHQLHCIFRVIAALAGIILMTINCIFAVLK
jgi:hypothetical protein